MLTVARNSTAPSCRLTCGEEIEAVWLFLRSWLNIKKSNTRAQPFRDSTQVELLEPEPFSYSLIGESSVE